MYCLNELKTWSFRHGWIKKPQSNATGFHLSLFSLNGHSPLGGKMSLGRYEGETNMSHAYMTYDPTIDCICIQSYNRKIEEGVIPHGGVH